MEGARSTVAKMGVTNRLTAAAAKTTNLRPTRVTQAASVQALRAIQYSN